MGAPYPTTIPEPFANDADGAHRNTIPDTTVNPQRASWSLGFPPQTMTPVIAGGKPMLGPDMNGTLYAMSSHTFYQQTGQPYRWNADVLVALGSGYAVGTLLGSTDGLTLWYNIVNGNINDPDSNTPNSGWVPVYSYGMTLLPPTNGGVITLTPAQASKSVIVVSGALVANVQVVFPNTLRRWLVVNTCTGGFVVTAKTAAGAGVAIPAGGFGAPTEVYGDGTNLYNVVAPITLPTDVAPTPNTIVLRSNNGYVFATYFNQSSALENFSINEVFAGIGDGYLRKINRTNFAANFLLSWFAGQVADGQVPLSAVNQYRATILNDSALTGTPTAPTPAAGDSSTKVATTAFVQTAIGAQTIYSGYMNAGGGGSGPAGWTLQRLGQGWYRVTHNLGASVRVVCTIDDAVRRTDIINTSILNGNVFDVFCQLATDVNQTRDRNFSFLVARA
jgi:hypothetical protein